MLLEQATVNALMGATIGLFFAIRGGQKLCSTQRRSGLVKTLQLDHYPAIGFFAWWIPAWEFAMGTMLVLGVFVPFAAAVLGLICLIAILTDKIAEVRVKRRPKGVLDWVCCIIFLTEVPMGLILLHLANGVAL